MKNAETRNVKGIPILVVFAALSAFAAPVIPGEFTDPSNIRKATESLPGDWYVAPEHLKFPYISTYHVVPTLTTKDRVEIPFYVTDWDHSKVRFLDDSFRFDVHFKCICQDGKVRERTLENLSSGDHAFQFDAFPEGEYRFCVWASDAKGRESHRVWHRFRVVPPDYVKIADERTYRMTAADLAAYGIRNDGDLGRKVLVDFPKPPKETKGDEVLRLAQEALGKYAAENPPAAREGTPGYTIYIAARDGKPVVGSWRMSKIVYDTGYDTNAVEQAAIATAEGLQKLLNDKAAAGFRKVVLLPGTYRVSAFRKVSLPDALTLDLNGAVLKENAFAGCHSVIVDLANVNDAHLVNGTLEGDYYEHDYENSGNNSEWPMGFHIEGDASYCSVENVTVRDITGYGAGNGMGRVNGSLHWFYAGIPWSENPTVGGLDPKDGTVDASEKGRYTSDYIKVEKAREAGWLQISAYLGYQGIRGGTWQMTGCWYDAGKKFLASETIFQYRPVPVPEGAAFLRISIVAPDGEQARKSGLTMTLFHIPYNCAVRNCTFDRCRCVGYAASAMKNFLFEGNLDEELSFRGQPLHAFGGIVGEVRVRRRGRLGHDAGRDFPRQPMHGKPRQQPTPHMRGPQLHLREEQLRHLPVAAHVFAMREGQCNRRRGVQVRHAKPVRLRALRSKHLLGRARGVGIQGLCRLGVCLLRPRGLERGGRRAVFDPVRADCANRRRRIQGAEDFASERIRQRVRTEQLTCSILIKRHF